MPQQRSLRRFAVFVMSLAVSPLWAEDAYSPKVGEPHPPFVLPRISDRQPVALANFRGKKVLLIHFASW